MKMFKMDNQYFDEFVMIFLVGLHTCYETNTLDAKRLTNWFLNGKTSKSLSKLISIKEVGKAFETFEEIMRFEEEENRDIIDFETEFFKIKEEFFKIIKEISQNQSSYCFLEIMEE